MRIALISDVHSNLEALEKVLKALDKEKIDEIYFLGDAIGYGVNPNEVIELLEKQCKIKLMGNHDYCALGLMQSNLFNSLAKESIQYTTKIMTDESLEIISKFTMNYQADNIYLVHSTPVEPESWFYCLHLTHAEKQFHYMDSQICFLGHTHLPAFFTYDPEGRVSEVDTKEIEIKDDYKYIVNAGSVGQPRDHDPRACYLIYDNKAQTIALNRVEYSTNITQKKILNAQLPEFLANRILTGR